VNAVLRRVSESGAKKLKALPETLNIPPWLRRNWRAAHGAVALKEMAAELVREPGLDITVKHPQEAQEWARRLGGVLLPTGTIRIEKPPAPVPELPGFAQGAWWVQDVAAALPVRLAGDVRGKRVADLCAAPGGKTAQLAAAGADVVAVDVSAKRLARLRENLQRLKLEAQIVCSDVLAWKPAEKFDLVLLDAPCTATGTYRRHPDVLWSKSPEQMRELVDLQARMLRHAAGLVKEGGMLIYCVCSLQPEEGEAQAGGFLEEHGGAFARRAVAADEVMGLEQVVNDAGDVRTLPFYTVGEERGMDGFFITRLIRG
jgi:16S rRNA (cytosine967-C5)-methyltransferase